MYERGLARCLGEITCSCERVCGASFHIVIPVKNMAYSLNLKYVEIIVGVSYSKLNKLNVSYENMGNTTKLSRVCYEAIEREERS